MNPPGDGAENMAIDEAMVRACESGGAPPTLRLYEWKVPTLSIGYMQDATPFLGYPIPVVRRITGGRAVLHHAEITYSIVCGTGTRLFSYTISGVYRAVSACIVKALQDMGIRAGLSRGRSADSGSREACFDAPSRYEITVGGKKLVGSAQRRFRGALLQHGSILLDIDRDVVRDIFGDGLLKRMTSLSDISIHRHWAVDKEAFKEALIQRISEGLGVSFVKAGLSEAEMYIRGRLLEEKYSKQEWNILRSTGSKELWMV